MTDKPPTPDELGAAHGCAFAPLHPARLAHPLEGTLRREWERYIAERPGFDLLSGPEVHFLDVPPGVDADENKITGGYQPYPYGRMTDRDKMLAAELMQWLGSPLGFAFLSTAFERAGGRVVFDDYKHNKAMEVVNATDEDGALQTLNTVKNKPNHKIVSIDSIEEVSEHVFMVQELSRQKAAKAQSEGQRLTDKWREILKWEDQPPSVCRGL